MLFRSKKNQQYSFKDEGGNQKNGETRIQYIPEDEKEKYLNSSAKDDYIDYKEVK